MQFKLGSTTENGKNQASNKIIAELAILCCKDVKQW